MQWLLLCEYGKRAYSRAQQCLSCCAHTYGKDKVVFMKKGHNVAGVSQGQECVRGKRWGVMEFALRGERVREELHVRTVCCWQTEMTMGGERQWQKHTEWQSYNKIVASISLDLKCFAIYLATKSFRKRGFTGVLEVCGTGLTFLWPSWYGPDQQTRPVRRGNLGQEAD